MTPLQSSHCSEREGDVEFHRRKLVNSVNRQFAVSDSTHHGELLCSLREVSTSCPQFQWAPLQLKGCTQKYFIALYHNATGGLAAHCTCPRRCSRHHNSEGCEELWLLPGRFPGCPFLPSQGSSSVRTLRGQWYMSAAPAGAFSWLHALLPGQGLRRFVTVFVRRGPLVDSDGRLRVSSLLPLLSPSLLGFPGFLFIG